MNEPTKRMWLARYDVLKRKTVQLGSWIWNHPGTILGAIMIGGIIQISYICWHAGQPASPERIKTVMAMNYCTKQLIPGYIDYYKDAPLTNEQVGKAIYECDVAMEKWEIMAKQKAATK